MQACSDERDFELLRGIMNLTGYDNAWANSNLPAPVCEWWPNWAVAHMRETKAQVVERIVRLGRAGVVTKAGPNLLGLGPVRKKIANRAAE